MLNENIISNFLGIRNVLVDKIREKNKFIKIYLSTAKSTQICPCCKSKVNRIHDYRKRIIKHSSFRKKQLLALAAEESNSPEFKSCITAFRNWFGYIINGYKHKVTNGFTEGMNNNIKVLKRIAFLETLKTSENVYFYVSVTDKIQQL